MFFAWNAGLPGLIKNRNDSCPCGCGKSINVMENKIEVRKSDIQGRGVFAMGDFRRGQEVFRYRRGRFVVRDQIQNLSDTEKDHLDIVDESTYEIMVEPGCYVNHSCDPNTIEKVGKEEIVSYALRSIKIGEEITVDYRIRSAGDWKLKCLCDSGQCSGEVIGNFFSMPEELQKRYLPYAPVFIQEKYKKCHSK